MKEDIFVTGATGHLGAEIVRALLQRREAKGKIILLVRASDDAAAQIRLRSLYLNDPELFAALKERLEVLAGDITKPRLGLSKEKARELAGRIAYIVHCAGEVNFMKDKADYQAVNIEGTARMISFGRFISRCGGLKRFMLMSTAYTAGTRSGLIREADPRPSSFYSLYEASKARAEELVQKSGLPFTICRPSMIVGSLRDGRAMNFNTIYYILKLYLAGELSILPISKDQPLNLIPSDEAARSASALLFLERAAGRAFHLTPDPAGRPTAGELIELVRSWAESELSLKLPSPYFVPMPPLKAAGYLANLRDQAPKKSLIQNLTALLPYFFDSHAFERSGTDALTGPCRVNWEELLPRLLSYAVRYNFLPHSDRSVFEQVLFRLKSRHAPIRYYDLNKEGPVLTDAPAMRTRIDKNLSSLIALGAEKGDRIAITGINSSDYFALDTAIGLAGAVSVPIYYTTPPAEISELLKRSGAKWFFIGDRRIMDRAGEIGSKIPLIGFSEGREGAADLAMSYRDFLKLGEGTSPLPLLMDPLDLATIRYTSGTTGESKGVLFDRSQLKWMGEVMTALLPYRDRTRELRYLSFLPLSHVVEGILASYAPYYVHTPVRFYYLNDFSLLTEMLPKVRPTVFFSVPRFYEKLWDQITSNPLGRRWLAMKEGHARDLLGRLIRSSVLKKAGLDACSMLIVGSAPISEELLRSFRALGIEIHNAYGETEAPLIAMNRYNDNVIPSVGTALPDTSVTQENGELIVRGPQVCRGYEGITKDSVKDGVLKSGDRGWLDDAGHIYLTGRIREVIITAYGKNISIPKVEERLLRIPCVGQAVLIGEKRPYLTALLWLNGSKTGLEAGIEEMNRSLSHPEQIRRYCVVERPLTVEKGELTPNLKIRRHVVEAHFAKEIEAMYGESGK